MDFLARSGHMLDRAHRLAGFLLVILALQTMLMLHLLSTNTSLNAEFNRTRERLSVYVVPGSQAGVYSPTQDQMLLETFVSHVTQSLETFTFQTLQSQFDEIKMFFAPEMLSYAEPHYAALINKARIDQRSSLFIPTSKVKMEETPESSSGADRRAVSIEGNLQQILSGSVVETIPVRITMTIQKTVVSKTNPFGFMLVSYREEELKGVR